MAEPSAGIEHQSESTAAGASEPTPSSPTQPDLDAAAQTIQRRYRGYRERRQLAGMGVDASTRWVEVCCTLSLRQGRG